jgi:hypothetical protein
MFDGKWVWMRKSKGTEWLTGWPLSQGEAIYLVHATDEPRVRICAYDGCVSKCEKCDIHFDNLALHEGLAFIETYDREEWQDGSRRRDGPDKLEEAWQAIEHWREKYGPEGRDESVDDHLLWLWGRVVKIVIKDAPESEFAKKAVKEIGERWGTWQGFIEAMREVRRKCMESENEMGKA